MLKMGHAVLVQHGRPRCGFGLGLALKKISGPRRCGRLLGRLGFNQSLFVLFVLIALSGCAAPRPSPPADVGHSVPRSAEPIELRHIPFFPQTIHQCGPAALATLLTWAGERVTPQILAPRLYLPARRGSLAAEIVAEARSRGFLVYRLPPHQRALYGSLRRGHPVMVLQDLGPSWWPVWHFAVMVGMDPPHRKILLRSGAEPRKHMTWDAFEQSWSGRWAIVVLPPGELPFGVEEDRYVEAAIALESKGPADAALAAYRAGLTHWPENAALSVGLANVLYAQGEVDRAAAHLSAWLKRHPASPVALNNLAMLRLEQGRVSEAGKLAEEALKQAPKALEEAVRDTLMRVRSAQQRPAP